MVRTLTAPLQVRFGALVPKIKEQPIGKLLRAYECRAFQEAADAVVILRAAGLLPTSESDRVLTRLGKRICKVASKSALSKAKGV